MGYWDIEIIEIGILGYQISLTGAQMLLCNQCTLTRKVAWDIGFEIGILGY